MKETEDIDWDLEITSKTGLLDVKLKDVWHYRDLLFLLVRRDFVSFYKQTILGPIWFFVQPIITVCTYNLVFNKLASLSTDGIPGPLFYMSGVIIWNYFADCLTKTAGVFRDNSALFGKVYFPRLIMPLSIVLSNLIRFAVQMVLFLVLLLLYNIQGISVLPSVYILLFPILLVLLAALGLGLGMMISAVTTKYRDLSFVVAFAVPLLMYTTTIIYPLSTALNKYSEYSWLVKYNPITAIAESFRMGFLGKGSFSWELLAYSTTFTGVILIIGVITFNKVEKTFIDTI